MENLLANPMRDCRDRFDCLVLAIFSYRLALDKALSEECSEVSLVEGLRDSFNLLVAFFYSVAIG